MKALDWCRARPWTWAAAAGVSLGIVGFAVGRFAAPIKVVEKTERVDVATSFASWDWKAESLWTQTSGPVHRTTTRRTAPARPAEPAVNGICPACPEVDEEIVEEDIGPVVTTQEGTSQGAGQAATEERHEERTEKTVERAGPRVALFATVGLPFSAGGVGAPQYGLAATATVLGPVSVLVAGSGGVLGGLGTVGVGLTF